jgi:acyl-CoA thioester hydrolase
VTTAPTPTPAPHLHHIAVRYSDLDTVRHVNNARYISYIEDARVSFLRGIGLPGGRPNRGRVLARTEIDYVAPIFLEAEAEPVVVATSVERVGTRSFTLRQIISHHGTVRARALVVLVAFDVTLGASRLISDEERAALEACLVA